MPIAVRVTGGRAPLSNPTKLSARDPSFQNRFPMGCPWSGRSKAVSSQDLAAPSAGRTQATSQVRTSEDVLTCVMNKSRTNTNDGPAADVLGVDQNRPAAVDPEKVARYWRGHAAEAIAALWLMLRGYRILARRHRTPFGEIDIIARRGRRLAFVEVKRRPTLAQAEGTLAPIQAERIGRAAEHFMRGKRRYRDHEMGMDLILVGARGWPRYLPNAFHAPWDAWKRR